LPKPHTAPDRLAWLLPWLNGDRVSLSYARLLAFVASFDGTAEVGYVKAWESGPARKGEPRVDRPRRRQPPRVARPVSLSELEKLRLALVDLLRRGFGAPGQTRPRETWGQEFPSLRFGVRGAGRPSPGKLSQVSMGERRAYLSPGAYTLLVDGALVDLVPFLVLHLLTGPGMMTVSRCRAPAPRNWSERCGRFLAWSGRGRPRKFCSGACRVRHQAEALQKDEKEWFKRQGTRKGRRKK
jgi:hypothetical protein